MESTEEIRERIKVLARELANEMGKISGEGFGSPFEAIEVLAAELGDGLMREFACQQLLIETTAPPPKRETCCPDCGTAGKPKKFRSRKLQTIRGEIDFHEPEYHCQSCRRSFFPFDPLAGRGTGQ